MNFKKFNILLQQLGGTNACKLVRLLLHFKCSFCITNKFKGWCLFTGMESYRTALQPPQLVINAYGIFYSYVAALLFF